MCIVCHPARSQVSPLPTTLTSHPITQGLGAEQALRSRRSGDGEVVREVQMEDRRVEILVDVQLPSFR